MARNIKKFPEITNNVCSSTKVVTSNRPQSVPRHWGTELENKLAKIPLTGLLDTFGKAATVIENLWGVDSVNQCVQYAELNDYPIEMPEISSSPSSFRETAYWAWVSGDYRTEEEIKELEIAGATLAIITLCKLWRLYDLYYPDHFRLGTSNRVIQLVKDANSFAEMTADAYMSHGRPDKTHVNVLKTSKTSGA
jgi:hypothetical protein